MTLYNIGPGQEYETLAELRANETLYPKDIIDGGNSLFPGTWYTNNSGDVSGDIVFRNAIVDGELAQPHVFNTIGSYQSLINLTLKNGTVSNLYTTPGTANSNISLQNIRSEGSNSHGIYFYNTTDISSDLLNVLNVAGIGLFARGAAGELDNVTINSAGSYGVHVLDSGVVVLRNLSITGASNYSVYVSNSDDFDGSNFDITTPESIHGVVIENSTDANLSNVTVHNASNAVEIKSGSNNGSVDGLVANGCKAIVVDGSTGVDLSNIHASDLGEQGVLFSSGSSNGSLVDSYLAGASVDNFDMSGATTGVSVKRVKSVSSGTIGNDNSGDGFSIHAGCSANFAFTMTKDNLNTAHAHITDSTGTIYHHTSVNDGDPENFTRAALHLPGTGAWVVKNSIFYHDLGYPIAHCGLSPAITADYNVYISNLATPFMINSVSGKTFSEWVAAVGGETHSIFIHINCALYDVYNGSAPGVVGETLTYCPVDSNGRPVNRTGNPILSINNWISGVNDGGEKGIDGKMVNGLPIPGCYQGVGVPPATGFYVDETLEIITKDI